MKAIAETKSKIFKISSKLYSEKKPFTNNLDNKIKEYRRKSVRIYIRDEEAVKDQQLK